jgi:hypothetical protein
MVGLGSDPGSARVAQLVGSTWVKTTVSFLNTFDLAIASGGGHVAVVFARDTGGIYVSTT